MLPGGGTVLARCGTEGSFACGQKCTFCVDVWDAQTLRRKRNPLARQYCSYPLHSYIANILALYDRKSLQYPNNKRLVPTMSIKQSLQYYTWYMPHLRDGFEYYMCTINIFSNIGNGTINILLVALNDWTSLALSTEPTKCRKNKYSSQTRQPIASQRTGLPFRPTTAQQYFPSTNRKIHLLWRHNWLGKSIKLRGFN